MWLRDRQMSEYVPLSDHATPRIVLLKDGSALAMFQVDGIPAETLDSDVLYAIRRKRNHALCGLSATDGIVLHSWVCRGFAPRSIYPNGTFRSRFAQALDRRYQDKLFDRFLYL